MHNYLIKVYITTCISLGETSKFYKNVLPTGAIRRTCVTWHGRHESVGTCRSVDYTQDCCDIYFYEIIVHLLGTIKILKYMGCV
jgi:hypothetical protein